MLKTSVILVMTFLLGTSFANDYCSTYSKENIKYEKSKKVINNRVISLSKSPLIALQSDKILSKLLKEKSPILKNWMKTRNLSRNNELKLIKEWRIYYTNNFIIQNFKSQDAKVKKSIEMAFRDLNKYVMENNLKSLTNSFNRAKKDSIEYIKNHKSLSKETKQNIINKFSQIKLYKFTKIEGTKLENAPLEYLKWGLSFDPINLEINLGLEALKLPNEVSLYASFIHEIAHSIDPCRWQAFMTGANPFKKVINCLRSTSSVQALKRDDSVLEKMIAQNRISKDMAKSLKMNPSCNKTNYPPIPFQKDQINEVFSDWFSSEVITYKKIESKELRLDLCKKKNLNKGSSYVTNEKRLYGLYLVKTKYSKKYSYCAF